MLEITSIKDGLVLDHIEAGRGVEIFKYLGLDNTDYRVALIINADSEKFGKKDIIKIENCGELDYTLLALLSPTITICEIKNEKLVRKIKPELPEKVYHTIKCKNPVCITQIEKYVKQSFTLVDREKARYKCDYCDNITRL